MPENSKNIQKIDNYIQNFIRIPKLKFWGVTATLRAACGEELRRRRMPRSLATASIFCLFPFSQEAILRDSYYNPNPLDYVINKPV